MKRPIRKVILKDGIKAVVDTIIAFAIFFLWKDYGLALALPIFIFILIIVAPLVGLERLLLIATVFLGLTVDMAKENKFSEVAILFWVVVVCIVIDKGIRILKRGLPNLIFQLLEDPYTRNMCFPILGAVIFYSYSFYEYYKSSDSLFATSGTTLLKALELSLIGSVYGDMSIYFVMVLAFFPGAAMSAVIFRASELQAIQAIIGSFLGPL